MYRLLFSLFALSFILQISACGTPLTRETAGEVIHQELCQWLHQRCCAGKTINPFVTVLFGKDLETCKQNYDKDVTIGNSTTNLKLTFDKTAQNQTLDFNNNKAQECLNVIRTSTCNLQGSPINLEASCSQIFTGNLQEGADCSIGDEADTKNCAPSLYCKTSSFEVREGKCEKRAKVNESCEEAPCEESHYCDRSEEPFSCRPKISKGGSCKQSDACISNLACVSNSCSDDPSGMPICQ